MTRGRRVTKWVTITLGGILAVCIGGAVAALVSLNSSVHSEDIGGYLPSNRPSPSKAPTVGPDPLADRALNYVLIGSDSRAGDNGSIGGGDIEGMRSDTTIVAHISKDRSRVDLVSIPRDSMVSIPRCRLSTGKYTEAASPGQFNSAFSRGDNLPSSIACTVNTVEANTGLPIDGYAVVDFAGFEHMVDALGGIQFNVPEDMVASKANLNLRRGPQVLSGQQALAYARARTMEVGTSDGSDIGRIARQQALMGAFVDQTLSAGTLANPAKVYQVANATLDSLTLSPELGSVPDMVGFIQGFASLRSGNVHFSTVPTTEWPEDHNRVVWTSGAKDIWKSLALDQPLPGDSPSPSPSNTPGR